MGLTEFELVLLLILASLVGITAMTYLFVSRKRVDAGWILAIGLFWSTLWSAILMDSLPFHNFVMLVIFAIAVLTIVAVWRRITVLSELLKSKTLWLLTLAVVYAFLSVSWSGNPEYGYWKLRLLTFYGMVFGISFFIVFRTHQLFSWKPVIIAGVVFSIALHAYGEAAYAGRVSLLGQNPIWSSRLALLLAAVALWDSTQKWYVRMPLFGIAVSAAWITQSRGPFVAFLLASAIVLIEKTFFRKDTHLVGRTGGVILLLVLASFGILLAVPDHDARWAPPDTRMEILYSPVALFADLGFTSRMDMLDRATHLFADSPLIGVGIGGFAARFTRNYPHNIVMEVASELGLFGALLWGAVVVPMLRLTKVNVLLRVTFIQTLMYAMFSGDLAVNYEWLLFGIVAVAVARSKCKQQTSTSIQSHAG